MQLGLSLKAMHQGNRMPAKLRRKFKSGASKFIQCLIEDNGHIVESFAYSPNLGVKAITPFARPVSELPSAIRTGRNDRQRNETLQRRKKTTTKKPAKKKPAKKATKKKPAKKKAAKKSTNNRS
jgi:hypothetical protein